MKFDVVLGNPPYSAPAEGKITGKRASELYTKFFKFAIDHADIIAMILPTTDTKLQKEHNDLLKQYANKIEYIDSSLFPNISMPTWYVICDKTISDKADIHWALGKTRNNIPWTKGGINMTAYKILTGGHGDNKQKFNSDITIYHKVNETRGLVIKYGRKNSVSKRQMFPEDGYALLLPQTFGDTGWSKTEIVKCNGKQSAFNGINIVFFKTKKEAEDLRDYMKTYKFIDAANKVKQGFNNMNLSSLKSINIKNSTKNNAMYLSKLQSIKISDI